MLIRVENKGIIMSDFDFNNIFKPIDFFSFTYKNTSATTVNPDYIAKFPLPKGKGWKSVASKFIISKKDFIKNNPQLAKYFNNEKLAIPAGTNFNVPGHKAQKGDTASSIARRYGMMLKEFLDLNNLTNKASTVVKDRVYFVYAEPSEAYKKSAASPELVPGPIEVKPPLAALIPKNSANLTDISTGAASRKNILITEISDEEKIKSISTKADVSKATGISADFIDRLIEFEGVKRQLSEDPIDRPIVGIGHDLACRPKAELAKYRKLKAQGHKLSDKEIYQLLTKDILEAQSGLKRTLGANYSKLTRSQREALIDLVFNLGITSFRKSKKLIKHIEDGCSHLGKNPKKAAACFYNAATEFDQRSAGGRILPGLCKRRINDMILFTNHKPSQMPRKVLEKLYETYAKGLFASRNRTEFFRTTNELMGTKLIKTPKGHIEAIALHKPTAWITNKKTGIVDTILKKG